MDLNVKYLSYVFTIFLITLTGCKSIDFYDETGTTKIGYFIDSPVEGLVYETESGSGVTDVNGKFHYSSLDKKVVFKIGSLTLGDVDVDSIKEDAKVLPSDLVGVDRNNTTDDQLVKLLQVIQTLDSDNNGITLDTTVSFNEFNNRLLA